MWLPWPLPLQDRKFLRWGKLIHSEASLPFYSPLSSSYLLVYRAFKKYIGKYIYISQVVLGKRKKCFNRTSD